MRKTRALYFSWGLWAGNFCPSDKIVDAVFPKLRYTFQEQKFRGNCFRKYLVAYFYSVFERKHFVLWGKTFSSFLKTAYYVYRSILVVLFSSYCGLWRYQISSKMFLVFLSKISFYQSKKTDGGHFVFRKKLCSCQNFWNFGRKRFRLSSRICIVRLQDNSFQKKFCLGLFFVFLWLWAAICQPLS